MSTEVLMKVVLLQTKRGIMPENELFSKLAERVVAKPKPKRKRKASKVVRNDVEAKNKRVRVSKCKEGECRNWWHKEAKFEDFENILSISVNENGDVVPVFDATTTSANAHWHIGIVRHLCRKAREIPQLQARWQEADFLIRSDDGKEETVTIPLNCRNSSRGEGDAKERATQAIETFKKMGIIDKCNTATFKDLGYSSSKSREWLGLIHTLVDDKQVQKE